MRICEANTRILRAKPQPYIDAMLSNLSLPCTASTEPQTRGESNSMQGASVRKTSRQRRVGRAFLTAAQAENPSRNPHSDWDVVSGWHIKRKLRPGILIRNGMQFPNEWLAESSPGIRAQNGTRFPNGGPSGKFIPESRLKLGRAFRSISSTPKPARSPFQNWVEESQNETAGGHHDCRR